MIKFNVAVYILVLIFLFNCKTEDDKTRIVVNLESTGIDNMEVFNISDDLTFYLSGLKDSIILDIEDEVILDLYQGRYHSYIHVKPGERLLIDTISAIPITLGVTNNPSPENRYLDTYWRLEQESSYSYIIPELTKLPIDDFIKKMDEKNKPIEDLIKTLSADNNVSDDFKQLMANRFIATKSNDLSYYKDFYKRHFDEEPVIPSDYYQLLESVDLTDSSFLDFEEGRQIVSNYHKRDIVYNSKATLASFYKIVAKSARDLYGNSLVTKYCEYELVSQMINFGDDLDAGMAMANSFKSRLNEEYFKTRIAKLTAPWEGLVAGSPALDFIATTIDGKTIKLSDLKGSKIYIDIWATWCGPCIAEIPALKKLEEELSQENIKFVSISIDEEKDIEKWKKFVTDKQLTGLQLIADGAWNSTVATAYNIKGIPRFLLIDEVGKIISANAPRPSSENIKKLLLN